MALRRASLRLVKAAQVHNASVGVRPAAACMQIASSAPASESGRSGRDAFERSGHGRSFAQQLHSSHQSKNDDHEVFDYEKSKMRAEGGGTHEDTSFEEKAEEVMRTKSGTLNVSGDAKGKAEEAVDTVKEKASEEADAAKGTTQQVSETATELKEVGIEAGKAVVRDAGKVAEKVGLTSDAGKVTETMTELKEVGQEAGKAAVRDSKKLAEKVGLK